MLALFRDANALAESFADRIFLHNDDKVMVFGRGALLLAFNFHPTQSYTDYGIETAPGEFELVMDTDEARFGGHARLEPGQHVTTVPPLQVSARSPQPSLKLYLPARTALVLRRV